MLSSCIIYLYPITSILVTQLCSNFYGSCLRNNSYKFNETREGGRERVRPQHALTVRRYQQIQKGNVAVANQAPLPQLLRGSCFKCVSEH